MERREESKAVKNALKGAGIDVLQVKHATGTAWGWLHIKLARPLELACEAHGSLQAYDRKDCDACCAFTQAMHVIDRRAIEVALQVTGRRSNPNDCYDGNIAVHFDA